MSQSNPYYQRFPRDEFADTGHLTCEEYGLFQRLRDWSWHHEGIPDSKDSFKRLARMFQLSRYKFEKLWNGIENFFTLSNGFFTYENDEKKRLTIVDISTKRKKAGQLGAEARWSTRHQTADSGMANGMANAMANGPVPDMANEPHHHQNPDPDSREVPPPPQTPPEEHGGGGAPPVESNQELGEVVTDHEALNKRSTELGMPGMGKQMAKKIREKFPRQWSQREITAALVRFPGQESPAMWGALELSQLIEEAKRQASEQRKGPGAAAAAAQADKDKQALEMVQRARGMK